MTEADGLDGVLAEQVAYHRARAPEYQAGALTLPGGNEVVAALDSFRLTGCVLELACGTGAWTAQLLRHADAVTAVEFSPEMLELAGRRVGKDPRVGFVVADVFTWRPTDATTSSSSASGLELGQLGVDAWSAVGPRLSAWILVIRSVNSASANPLADSGRSRQA